MSTVRLSPATPGRLRWWVLEIICAVAALVVVVIAGPGLIGAAARNWGYIALNRAGLGPTYSLGRCGPASPYTQKADAAFTFARRLANYDARTESGLAIIRLCSGDLASATQLLQNAHRALPSDPVIGARLGNAKLLAGNATGAVAEWNDAGAAPSEVRLL